MAKSKPETGPALAVKPRDTGEPTGIDLLEALRKIIHERAAPTAPPASPALDEMSRAWAPPAQAAKAKAFAAATTPTLTPTAPAAPDAVKALNAKLKELSGLIGSAVKEDKGWKQVAKLSKSVIEAGNKAGVKGDDLSALVAPHLKKAGLGADQLPKMVAKLESYNNAGGFRKWLLDMRTNTKGGSSGLAKGVAGAAASALLAFGLSSLVPSPAPEEADVSQLTPEQLMRMSLAPGIDPMKAGAWAQSAAGLQTIRNAETDRQAAEMQMSMQKGALEAAYNNMLSEYVTERGRLSSLGSSEIPLGVRQHVNAIRAQSTQSGSSPEPDRQAVEALRNY